MDIDKPLPLYENLESEEKEQVKSLIKDLARNPSSIKDSGAREQFDTGSQRDTRSGKGRYDLIPSSVIEALARHLEEGSLKYKERNWEKGQPISRYYDSAMRHLTKFWAGHVDEMHIHAAIWNVMAIIETQEAILAGELPSSLDDHPRKQFAPLLLRVIRHVTLPDNLNECWNWEGTDNGNGYGVITIRRQKKGYVHRIICEEIHGSPPFADATVLHSCDNPSCVNPRHLSWGTDEENTCEAYAKGRKKSALSIEAQKFIFESDLDVNTLSRMFSISEIYVKKIKQFFQPHNESLTSKSNSDKV